MENVFYFNLLIVKIASVVYGFVLKNHKHIVISSEVERSDFFDLQIPSLHFVLVGMTKCK